MLLAAEPDVAIPIVACFKAFAVGLVHSVVSDKVVEHPDVAQVVVIKEVQLFRAMPIPITQLAVLAISYRPIHPRLVDRL